MLLLGTVLFVLMIACLNLANLLMSRAAGRRKEIAVRTALGAGSWHMIRQFLCESLPISVMGSAMGMLLARSTFGLLAHLAPGDIAGMKSLSLDGRVLAFTSVLAAAVAILFSVIPLIHARRVDIVSSLKRSGRTLAASGSTRTRAMLVASEVALAFVLATGAALLIQTVINVRGMDTGFRTRDVLTVGLPRWGPTRPTAPEIAAWQRDVLAQVTSIPGVVAAGFTNHVPIAFKGDISSVGADGRDENDRVPCRSRMAGPGYLSTMGIPVLHGRDIDARDSEGSPRVVLVNETLARELWPGRDAVGRSVIFEAGVSAPVVGVVRDIRQDGLDSAPKPEFYISSLQAGSHPGGLAIRTAVDPSSITPAVRQAVWSVDPEQPVVDVLTMEQILDEEVRQRRVQGSLLTVFAGLAVLLAAVGLYGVLAHSVGGRLPEFGVRMALGASPAGLLATVIGQGLGVVAAGLVAGLAGAVVLSRLIAAFLFGVTATDPATDLAVAIVLLLTAAVASYVPGRRAMRVDPAVALRQE